MVINYHNFHKFNMRTPFCLAFFAQALGFGDSVSRARVTSFAPSNELAEDGDSSYDAAVPPSRPMPAASSRAACLALVLIGTGSGLAAATPEEEAFFESEIRPVLATRCVSCHGPEQHEGGVRLDSREPVAATATGGLLSRTIRGQSTAPAACVLEPRLAEVFEQWIALGLPWPERATVDSETDRAAAGRLHWAFQLLRDPAVPALAGESANPIDAFVRERLEAAGLEPSPQADRRTLRRRLSFALTGLPPESVNGEPLTVNRPAASPVSDHRSPFTDEQWSQLVDELLASPRYGEHWARHWLDVARYSDTKGYVYAREEKNWPHAWAYRDWVAAAFNEDLPYDRFLLLQLAADQVGDRRPGDEAAMGFLTLGRRFLGVRHDLIDDRIDVVTRGMLGLTVGCARCHDHKYDPIPAADYYALHGVFDSSVERLATLGAGGDETFRKEHGERVAAFDEAFAKARKEAAERVRSRLADYLKAQTELENYPADTFGQRLAKTDLVPAFVHAWRDRLRDAADDADPVFAPWHAYAALPAAGFAEAARGIDWSGGGAHPRIASAFAEPPASFDEVVARYAAVLTEGDDDPDLVALRRGPGAPCEVPGGALADVESFFDSATTTELWKLNNEVDRGILAADPPVPAALLLVDRAPPVEPRVLLRGDPLNPGPRVPRRFLGALSGAEAEPFSAGSGRLELARAIADPANPLTARVFVNRVWTQLFGTGLVETPSDFGLRADPPSHPELLDWLATRFVEEDWSMKALVRRIVSSETWRQSSLGPDDPAARDRALELDPGNRLLWHMTPRRLGYEEFRDAMTAVSVGLDPALGGKPVEALTPPFSQRRALYGRIDRQFVPGVLRVFDFANPDLHIPRRNETTVPQQALFFLNHPFVLERSRALAKASEGAGAPPERVRELFRRALQREASDEEINEALAFVAANGEGLNNDQFLWSIALSELADKDGETPATVWDAACDFPADTATPLTAWEQLAQAVLCSNEFLFVD